MKAASLLIILCFQLLLGSGCLFRSQQRYSDFTTPTPLPQNHVLVLGILGGRQRWDSQTEGVRKLALRLRQMQLAGVHIETLENQKRALALQLIVRAFDRDRNGKLNAAEKSSAKIIVYGQSFGGAAVVKFARQLNYIQVPILLTIQIDSIGRHDHVIPPNVMSAANLFQRTGMIIRGEPKIRASKPAKTKIIGNYRFDYKNNQIDLSGVPWWKKIFRADHSRMNRDPAVWSLVQKLIINCVHAAE